MASSLTRPTPITIPWASLGNKRTIPTESQILEAGGDGKASYPDGYPPLCGTPLVSGGKPPSILDENGILFDITSNLRFLLAGGCPKFDADMATAINGYPVGAILQDNAGVNTYLNVVDGNSVDFNSTPSSIGVSWLLHSGKNTFSLGQVGWERIPTGRIWQWGLSSIVPPGSSLAITFPMAFPSAVFVPSLTFANVGNDSTVGDAKIGQVRALTLSQMTIRNLSATEGAQFFWTVIGK